MKEIDKGVLEETKIFKFGGGKAVQKRKWRERAEVKRREEGENEDRGFWNLHLNPNLTSQLHSKILNFFEFAFTVL